VCISDVADLYGWEFNLSWNQTILDVVEASEGAFLKNVGDTFFTYKINNTLGYMIVDCTLLGNISGVSGSGTLATIKFYVETLGECPLDLSDTILINSTEQSIEHTTIDGYYYTSVHDVAIIDLTASSTEVNVTVENQGTHTETFNVSAYYTRLSDPLIGTQAVTLTKGATAMLTFTWTPPSAGPYEIWVEANVLPGEMDVGDNTRSITIQVGWCASNLRGQHGNQSNGCGSVVYMLIFGLICIVLVSQEKLRYTNKLEGALFSKSKTLDYVNVWEVLLVRQKRLC
jgi:hypothetical protein